MTSWIETSGKTVEEAKEAAALELGVSTDEIVVDVLEEGTRGFLGFGQPKVRIKAAVAESREESVTPEGETVMCECCSCGHDHGDESVVETQQVDKTKRALEILTSVLESMQFDAKPELIAADDEEIQINVVGESDDLGRLIGRQGQTLDALQYLLGIAVNRGDTQKIRVVLDAENYRDRHRQMIEAKAREFAAKVKEMGGEAVLEPLQARDRRIVHMTLADDPDVYTYSEGVGEDRHIVISPKK